MNGTTNHTANENTSENNSSNSWMDHPAMKGMDPVKLELLRLAAKQTAGKMILHIPLGCVVLRSCAAVRLRAAINHMHSIVGIVRFWPARSSKTAPTANNSWKDSRRLVENCRVAGLRCQPADHPPALRAIPSNGRQNNCQIPAQANACRTMRPWPLTICATNVSITSLLGSTHSTSSVSSCGLQSPAIGTT